MTVRRDLGKRPFARPFLRAALWVTACLSLPAAAEPERAHGAGAMYAGEVGRELSHVEASWRSHGQVSVLAPRLVVRGASTELALPPAATDPRSSACATLLVLSSPNSVVSLTFGRSEPEARRDFPLTSTLGAVELTRCGARKAGLTSLVLEASSPRAVVSFLLVVGQAPTSSALTLLPNRQPGGHAPAPELGPRPRLGPVGPRLASKRRARASTGPGELVDGRLNADETGSIRHDLWLGAGCHVIDVLDAGADAGLADLDARLVDADAATWALDAGVAPEASLSTCVGEPRVLTLEVRGSAPNGELAFLRTSWPLPDGLPVEWGPRVRGRLAEALQKAPRTALGDLPIATALGVQGTTRVAVSVRPADCYVVAAAALDREPERLGLAVRAGGMISQSRARPGRASAAVTVCASGPELLVDVRSVGADAGFIVGVWELGVQEDQ